MLCSGEVLEVASVPENEPWSVDCSTERSNTHFLFSGSRLACAARDSQSRKVIESVSTTCGKVVTVSGIACGVVEPPSVHRRLHVICVRRAPVSAAHDAATALVVDFLNVQAGCVFEETWLLEEFRQRHPSSLISYLLRHSHLFPLL